MESAESANTLRDITVLHEHTKVCSEDGTKNQTPVCCRNTLGCVKIILFLRVECMHMHACMNRMLIEIDSGTNLQSKWLYVDKERTFCLH